MRVGTTAAWGVAELEGVELTVVDDTTATGGGGAGEAAGDGFA